MKIRGLEWYFFAVLSTLIIFFCIVSGNFFTKKVSIQLGEIAKETVYAPFQVENEMATNRKKQEAELSVQPIYKQDSTIQEKAIGSIEELFKNVNAVQTSDVADILGKTKVEVLSGRSTIGLYNEQYEGLLNASEETLQQVKSVCINTASELFAKGISPNNSNKSLEIRQIVEASKLTASMKRIAEDIISSVITANVVEDVAATNEQKKIVADKVDPVYVLAQEKIVEKGARVTEEVYKLLEKIGYLETNKSDQIKQYIGAGAFVIVLMGLYCYYIKKSYLFKKHSIGKGEPQNKQLSLVFIVLSLIVVLTRGFIKLPFVYLPLGVGCMMIAFAMGQYMAFMTQILIIIFAALIFKGDIVFILYFIVQGITSILIVARMHERTRTFMSAVYVGSIQMFTYITLKLLIGTTFSVNILSEGLAAFVVGMISVVIVIGALPMFESLFDFVTPMQLLEMTNPNQPILKRLLLEATGTYYHSLLVANLAEAAATRIGANALLARVGGYYHDIGKLTCSNYFKENQGSINPHDYMTPKESYDIIVSHVTSGIKLAEEYHLPNYIKDFIKQHHGTSTMQYFYLTARKEAAGEVKEEEFQYLGPKPQTKETALVMLADVVEATTRAMQDKLGKEIQIEDLVRKSVKQKVEEEQLSECELYLSDIDKIIDSFTKMLTGMYHQRIVYPERNDSK